MQAAEGNVESHYSTSDSEWCYACSLCNVGAHLGKPHMKPEQCPGTVSVSQRVSEPQRKSVLSIRLQPGVDFWPVFPHGPLGLPR